MNSANILIVDDEQGVRFALREVVEELGYTAEEANNGQQALDLLQHKDFHLVITDLRMPILDGFGLLEALQNLPRRPHVIVLTAHGSERLAVQAVQKGAYDYFRKPFDVDELSQVLQRALRSVDCERRHDALAAQLNLAKTMIFESEAMRELAVMVQRVAPREVSVLLLGESGCGKERVAEAIVSGSPRRDRPFIRFNCASLNANLVTAELCGHAKGSFTGAVQDRPGLFRQADGGTVLLDEVGELSLDAQANLLRILQEGEVRPVGSDVSHRIDTRVLAATHRDLHALVREGKFREDLYYRLRVVELKIPPLRARPDDIEPLARHFLGRYAARFAVPNVHWTIELGDRLREYHWPGNVRELENAIEGIVALSDNGHLDLRVLPAPNPSGAATTGSPEDCAGVSEPICTLRERLEAYERGLLINALQASSSNRTAAAKALGIGRATLHEKLRKFAISDDE